MNLLHVLMTNEYNTSHTILKDGLVIDIDRSHLKTKLFEAPPCMAVVVGTFAAVPYIHLQLESRRRFCPDVPYLVHDDCSPLRDRIAGLCGEYGVDFEHNSRRLPPLKGDLSAFYGGLHWAASIGANLLVKLSRRFVPAVAWTEELIALVRESDYATYCSWTTSFDFGFRTECLAMAVEEWIGHLPEIAAAIKVESRIFVEGFMHNLAKRSSRRNSLSALQFDERIGARPSDRCGYAPWAFMGTDRRARYDQFLWHDSANASDYANLAREWGLPYTVGDFANPNMGFGNKPS